MDSLSHLSPSSILGSSKSFSSSCSTPPRSNPISDQILINPSFSQLFRRPKLLTSAELKRRFSPIQSSKKRRHRKHDCVVPFERNLNMPLILQKLFDQQEDFTSTSADDGACMVPDSSSKINPEQQQPDAFAISETILKQKLKSLLAKN